MTCFEPVQVSTAFTQLLETYHNKGCDQPHSACTLLLERRRRRGRVCLPAFGAEGSLLAGGSPYSTRPARNIVYIPADRNWRMGDGPWVRRNLDEYWF
jgi:hypothetical protein